MATVRWKDVGSWSWYQPVPPIGDRVGSAVSTERNELVERGRREVGG